MSPVPLCRCGQTAHPCYAPRCENCYVDAVKFQHGRGRLPEPVALSVKSQRAIAAATAAYRKKMR